MAMIDGAVAKMEGLHLQQDFYMDSGQIPDVAEGIGATVFADALIHLFQPKKIEQWHGNVEEVDAFLLKTTSHSVWEALCEVHLPQLNASFRMLENWEVLQPTSGNSETFVDHFQKAIRGLERGHSLPIYVRNQNSTLIVRKPVDKDSIVLSSFRCSLPSEMVMSTVGSLHMQFPEFIETIINSGMLQSKAFAKPLYELTVGNVDVSAEDRHNYYEAECRDVADPQLVSDWMVGLLVPVSDTTSEQHDLQQFQFRKKMRDHVTKTESSWLPFRRSGMYMALKVSLQMKIWENLGSWEDAKLVYKIMMLRVLADVAKKYEVTNFLGMDLASQILAKLGRRVEKLNKLPVPAPTSTMESGIIGLKSKCLEHALFVVDKLSTQMKNLWGQVANNDSEKHQTWQKILICQDDLLHKIPQLDSFITELDNSIASKIGGSGKPKRGRAKQGILRCTSAQSILASARQETSVKKAPSAKKKKVTEPPAYVWLHDAANFIKYQCTLENTEASVIAKLVTTYISTAKSSYTNDPIGKSQMFLISLKGMELLDKIATDLYPLLLEYKPEVNPKIFECLLLPFPKDMKLLDGILDYFRERDQNATFPGILSNNGVNANTFSVRFAENDRKMIELLNRVLEDEKASIAGKYKEVDEMAYKCAKLEQQLSILDTCSCILINGQDLFNNTTFTLQKCPKCLLLLELNLCRTSVTRYERPLPQQKECQWAVIFDLLMPQEFAIFVNYLSFFKFEIFGAQNFNREQATRQVWLEYGNLARYKSGDVKMAIKLTSVSMPLSSTLPIKRIPLDVLNDEKEQYILDNQMNCIYHYCSQRTPPVWVEGECSFEVKTTTDFKPYSNLQDTLVSTNHTQNCILARQNQCHMELTLEEFRTFGSLRAGHQIQLRNLYEAIHSGSLSLDHESVVALILQTIWQVGPRNEITGERESHLDFTAAHHEFGISFLEMLEKLVTTIEANYSKTRVLLVAVAITRRIADLNESIHDNCYALLKLWRGILSTWTTKIENILNGPEADGIDIQNNSPLRKNLLEVIVCSLFSYDVVDATDISKVIRDHDDLVLWFKTLHQWHAFQNQAVKTSGFFKIIYNFVNYVPLRTGLEKKIVCGDEIFVKSLKDFISQRLGITKEDNFKSLEVPHKDHNRESLVQVEYLEIEEETGEGISNQITFDLIKGAFCINGRSQFTLPLQIKQHPLFERYFKDGSNLRIQQDNSNVTRTIKPFHGRHYELRHVDGNLIIHEFEGSTKLVMLDPQILSSCISNYFVDNYTHWLDTSSQLVYFRPIADTPNHSYDYILQRTHATVEEIFSWRLCDGKLSQFVLSIHSKCFQGTTRALKRLEMADYIVVTTPILPNMIHATATASLRRYNLSFTLDKMGELESVEYPSYRISANQICHGTLVGLHHGLILECDEKRLLILPHAEIQAESCESHQRVNLRLEALRQPPYFVYYFDDVIQRLKPHNNKSAWLYLAALHAVTSSVLPDPFTEVTGTESAMRILQSACVWSCSPYDEESKIILDFIKDLAPMRTWTRRCSGKDDQGSMESTKWPKDLPTMVAYDGFAPIVDQLISESETLSMLHQTSLPSNVNVAHQYWPDREKRSHRLGLRAYVRGLPSYNSAVAVENHKDFLGSQLEKMQFPKVEAEKLYKKSSRSSTNKFSIANLQHVSFALAVKHIFPLKQSGHFNKNTLVPFLITSKPLNNPQSLNNGFKDLLRLDFHPNWLSLYTMATTLETAEDFYNLGIILSVAAYCGAPLEQLANLHCIAIMPKRSSMDIGSVKFPAVPPILAIGSENSRYYSENPSSIEYDITLVNDILARNFKRFNGIPPYHVEDYYRLSKEERQQRHEKYNQDLEKYENDTKTTCFNLSEILKQNFWPPSKNTSLESISELLVCHNYSIDVPEAKYVAKALHEKFMYWHRNRQLKIFVEEIQEKLNGIWDEQEKKGKLRALCTPLALKERITVVAFENPSIHFNLIEDMLDASNSLNLAEVKNIFETGDFQSKNSGDNIQTDLSLRRNICRKKICDLRDNILQIMKSTVSGKMLVQTGIAPRLDPQSFLKILNTSDAQRSQNGIFLYAGALGVLWTHLQRFNRCIRDPGANELQQQMDNPGHQNWSPREHPEWLLLELELDLMIRPIQVCVAKQMLEMPDQGNGVTQLNMGEGKTSVIVPMLCATLAQRNSQLCRVTVLSSMFKMNLNSLTFSIGGLLNQPVYSFPCRRDMKIDDDCVSKIRKAYQECLDMRGVVLTVPEYRLSFRLIAYDTILKGNRILGTKMLGVENLLRKFARDILDESDELFSVKYQLVYTIGEQVPVDGGELRWTICQRILDIVQGVVSTSGPGFLEFDKTLQKQRPHEFGTVRLLRNDCMEQFLDCVADYILEQFRISAAARETVKSFLVENDVSREEHNQVLSSIFQDSPHDLNKILLYSGYLRRGVLALALTKRWRVEYGVHPKPEYPRLIAIPFRGKDVAAEKAEFGHPDLAIILTHLSYYYSGLNDKQMEQVFDILKGKHSPDAHYSKWIQKIPQELVPRHLANYYSLNLKDVHQKAELFEMLRRHKMAINFWLSHWVFPRECKQFPGKLVMTAWDLGYERQRLPVTGFSGTNDSRILLPLMISQHDLKELQDTNMNMEKTLLGPKNRNHKRFPMGVTCQQIIESMKQDKSAILLDAGALMLKCSNEQVADLWLEVDPDIEAAVYFSTEGELLVKSRGEQGNGTSFDMSPYQGRLEKCGVYLDQQHTIGTDLKFPDGSRACVTVATRMKRDKLIQACMRMRKLGNGHSVTFYLSHEVLLGAEEREVITTKAVLDWVGQNTKESNEEGLLYWAMAGRNYAQKLAAEDHFHFPSQEKPYDVDLEDPSMSSKALILAKQCVDDEVVKLMDMYGRFSKMELLAQLIPKWFNFTKEKLQLKFGGKRLDNEIFQKFNKILASVLIKCAKEAGLKMHLSSFTEGMMDEEQENELELEKEVEVQEEREVQRPPKAEEAIHQLHDKVKALVVSGTEIHEDLECFYSLCHIFENTSFWDDIQPECWPKNVFVTKDFVTTVQPSSISSHLDSFLRPIQYIISCKSSSRVLQLLVVSPFEVNELLPYFRSAQTKCTLHMFSSRRSEKLDLLLNKPGLLLPSNMPFEISDNGPEIASLLLVSGSLYFISMEEQKAFVRFLGLRPQPWSQAESGDAERGWITKSGFLPPQHRSKVNREGFGRDPSGLVRSILQCRHSIVSDVTHLLRLLDEKRYAEFL